MKRLAVALSLLLILVAVPAMAQQVTPTPAAPTETAAALTISPGEVSATPEMWFYQQELQRYQDPKEAVRAKAEFRAAQRRNRTAARKWFGFSNSRPTAGVDPVHGEYSPRWTSNNNLYPFRWSGYGQTQVVARPVIPLSRMY